MSPVTVRPLRRYTLVQLLPSPQLSSSLYTPTRQEVATRAEVLALGPECTFLKPGDVILVNAFLGIELPDNQKLVNEPDVLATIPA